MIELAVRVFTEPKTSNFIFSLIENPKIMNPIYMFLGLMCLLMATSFGCSERTDNAREEAVAQAIEDSKPIDPMERKVAGRLDYFDQRFFSADSSLMLSAAQREALSLVIRAKLEALEEAQLPSIEDRTVRKALRDSIRKSCHGRIDAHPRSEQVEARHAAIPDYQEDGKEQ